MGDARAWHAAKYNVLKPKINDFWKCRQIESRLIRSKGNELIKLVLTTPDPGMLQIMVFLASKCLGGNREAKSITITRF